MKKHKVTLIADERQSLHDMVATDKAAAKKRTHARILIKADAAPDNCLQGFHQFNSTASSQCS